MAICLYSTAFNIKQQSIQHRILHSIKIEVFKKLKSTCQACFNITDCIMPRAATKVYGVLRTYSDKIQMSLFELGWTLHTFYMIKALKNGHSIYEKW